VVRNDSDHPPNLVDGNLATGWSSRTGELKGAWIAFRVPAASRVRTVRLTVGFTRTSSDGDLFVMNPRIQAVRLWRGAARVGDFPLDVQKRTLQTLTLDQPGGDFRLEVTEVVPGTKKHWREITVTELEVRGLLPEGARRPGRPLFRTGSLDGPAFSPHEPRPASGPHADVGAFCTKHTRGSAKIDCEEMGADLAKSPWSGQAKVELSGRGKIALAGGALQGAGLVGVRTIKRGDDRSDARLIEYEFLPWIATSRGTFVGPSLGKLVEEWAIRDDHPTMFSGGTLKVTELRVDRVPGLATPVVRMELTVNTCATHGGCASQARHFLVLAGLGKSGKVSATRIPLGSDLPTPRTELRAGTAGAIQLVIHDGSVPSVHELRFP
jgi:hypothetical protein